VSVTELLAELARRGIQLAASAEGNLQISGPKGALTEALRAQVSRLKPEILALIRQRAEKPVELPRITPDLERRYEPFPLNEIQQAYWIGRGGALALGDVSIHAYWEVEAEGLEPTRIERTWQRLVERHDMLRVMILPDGQQQILKEVPAYRVETQDLRERSPAEAEAAIAELRERHSHQVFPVDQWPMFEVKTTLLPGNRTRVHFSVDLLHIDGASFVILARDFVEMYRQDRALPPLELSFRDYSLAEVKLREGEAYQRSLEYWRERVKVLPPAPELPLAKSPAAVKPTRFKRRTGGLEPERWRKLLAFAEARGLTAPMVLLSAYTEALAAWSKRPNLTVDVMGFNRLPLHPEVEELLGDFTSIVLLGLELGATESFEQRVRRVRDQLLKDLEHRGVNGVVVLRELARFQKVMMVSQPIVFTSLFGLGGKGQTKPSTWNDLGELVFCLSQTPQVWLDCQVYEEHGAFAVHWDAVEELFPAGLLDDMFQSFLGLIERLSESEEAWGAVQPRHVRLPRSQLAVREKVNATETPLPGGTLPELFARQVAKTPQQTAVVAAGKRLTYEEVYRRANQLSHRLKALGAQPETLVAVVMEKSWEQVVAVLAIQNAGAAYLPVDPDLPTERLHYMLQQGEAKVALTQAHLEPQISWPEGVQRVVVAEEPLGPESAAPAATPRPEELAYVIYTSGSTGLPKGVMIEHRSAVNRLDDVSTRFGIGPTDKVLALTALTHDMSVYDIFGVLGVGGTVVMPDPASVRDPLHWAELMRREGVTVWDTVPAFMEMLVESLERDPSEKRPETLRRVLLSGDWIPVNLPDRIRKLFPGAQVISMGGATETTIWDIYYPIEAVDPTWVSIPYGWPMTNAKYHLLTEAMEPCPTWVPGQIHMSGIGVARGFWRDEERTRAKFVIHPSTGERLYRAGDLGRYWPDGTIEFLGREDLQVKVQGYRIELGEIEAALAQHPSVRTAVATVAQAAGGKRRLVAFIVAEAADRAALADELLEFATAKLPRHMIPAMVVRDSLPITANGKVDRKALGALAAEALQPRVAYVAPNSELEQTIAKYVQEVLQLSEVSVDVQLFDLGATSMHIVRLTSMLREALKVDVRVTDPFLYPTVRALAAFLGQSAQQQPAAKTGVSRAEARLAARGRKAL